MNNDSKNVRNKCFVIKWFALVFLELIRQIKQFIDKGTSAMLVFTVTLRIYPFLFVKVNYLCDGSFCLIVNKVQRQHLASLVQAVDNLRLLGRQLF